jgi:hypothetical protein
MFADEKEIISGRSGIADYSSCNSNCAYYQPPETNKGHGQMHHEESDTLQQGF